jgi:hypothetical protein
MINEDAPTNAVAHNGVAGITGDPPVSKKAQRKRQRNEKSTPTPVILGMLRRKAPNPIAEELNTFAGAAVFEVSSATFHNARTEKRKGKHWRTYLDECDELAEIREYANRNPGKPIVLQNRNTNEMCYVRYGKAR